MLWERYATTDKPDIVWTIRGAHETWQTCDSALARDIATSRASLGDRVNNSGTDWVQAGPLPAPAPWLVAYIRFYCLPDTVDPRGPKGKYGLAVPGEALRPLPSPGSKA